MLASSRVRRRVAFPKQNSALTTRYDSQSALWPFIISTKPPIAASVTGTYDESWTVGPPVMGKAKPAKHTSAELRAKAKAATQNAGGGKAGLADRKGGAAGHQKFK